MKNLCLLAVLMAFCALGSPVSAQKKTQPKKTQETALEREAARTLWNRIKNSPRIRKSEGHWFVLDTWLEEYPYNNRAHIAIFQIKARSNSEGLPVLAYDRAKLSRAYLSENGLLSGDPISRADRLNGIQWQGIIGFGVDTYRIWEWNKEKQKWTWAEWHDNDTAGSDAGFNLVGEKKKDKWDFLFDRNGKDKNVVDHLVKSRFSDQEIKATQHLDAAIAASKK